MKRYGFVCLLLSALTWGQATAPSPAPAPAQQPAAPAPEKPAAAPLKTGPGPSAQAEEGAASKVAPDATVITVDGLCEKPPADQSAGSCKTTLTREQFEKIAPNMPAQNRRGFAYSYVRALVMSQKAHELGLDQSPMFEQRMALARLSILSQLVNQSLQEKASQIPDQDISDYYEKNKADYLEVELHHIVIPRTQTQNSKVKLSQEAQEEAIKQGEATMKAEADKIRARAVAGEDVNKLQEEAYQVAGLTTKPPTTDMGKVRRNNLPPAHASVMDLKPGAVSEVFSDIRGYVVYKVGAKDTLALADVQGEIHNTLRGQRYQAELQAMQKSATTTLNDTYFGPEVPVQPGRLMPPTKHP